MKKYHLLNNSDKSRNSLIKTPRGSFVEEEGYLANLLNKLIYVNFYTKGMLTLCLRIVYANRNKK